MTALEDARAALAHHEECGCHESADRLADALRALIAEHERVVAARDEVQEKIAYLRRNCMGLPEQELRQKIGAVGEAEWKLGYYWNTLVREERDRATRAEVAQREAEHEIERLTAPPTDDERHALEVAVREALGLTATTLGVRRVVDSLVDAGFRRQGPITDAELEAAAKSLSSLSDDEWAEVGHQEHMKFYWVAARQALEAARDAS